MNTARVFILIAYVLTGPTFVTACGHSGERLQTNGSIQRTSSAQDMMADKDLIEAVEVFASQGGEAGERAWKKMELSPRQDLNKSLERIRDTTKHNELLRIQIAYVLCVLGQDYDRNRTLVTSSMISRSNPNQLPRDEITLLIAGLIARGDKDLLQVLFPVSQWSDGSLSEALAATFVKETLANPDKFLLELKLQPKQIREKVYARFDEENLTIQDTKAIRAHLRTIPAKSPLTEVGRELDQTLSKLESRLSRRPP